MIRLFQAKWAVTLIVFASFIVYSGSTFAAPPVFEIEIRNHLFDPDVLHIPANTKIKLVIYNRDSTP